MEGNELYLPTTTVDDVEQGCVTTIEMRRIQTVFFDEGLQPRAHARDTSETCIFCTGDIVREEQNSSRQFVTAHHTL